MPTDIHLLCVMMPTNSLWPLESFGNHQRNQRAVLQAAAFVLWGSEVCGTACPGGFGKACELHADCAGGLVRALGPQLLIACWTELTTELPQRRNMAFPLQEGSQAWAHLHSMWESPRQQCVSTHGSFCQSFSVVAKMPTVYFPAHKKCFCPQSIN